MLHIIHCTLIHPFYPFSPIHPRGPQGRDTTEAEGPSHLGGPGGCGPPESFLKIGFKIVLFQSNFQHFRRNIAAYIHCTLIHPFYLFSPIHLQGPQGRDTTEAEGPSHLGVRGSKPFGGSGGPWPPEKFFEYRV